MEAAILCSHCQTPAVAEIDGDYVCAGCLMSILMCLEESIPVTPIENVKPDASEVSDQTEKLKHIYQTIG